MAYPDSGSEGIIGQWWDKTKRDFSRTVGKNVEGLRDLVKIPKKVMEIVADRPNSFKPIDVGGYRYEKCDGVVVIDGDTFDCTQGNYVRRVRIRGIDAPEKKQEYGDVALFKLREITDRGDVSYKKVDTDVYGRAVGHAAQGANLIGVEMITTGNAIETISKDEIRDPEDARIMLSKSPGVKFSSPAEFRRMNKKAIPYVN